MACDRRRYKRDTKQTREQTKTQRGIGTTKAGTLLKWQVPIRTSCRMDRCPARVL